ncbi:MAG: MFS transporter [Pseudomonadales bacterium]|nr:MFS transporter [Pseudomonadales bacterium]
MASDPSIPARSGTAPRRRQLAVLVFGLVTTSMANTVLFTVLGPLAREIGLTEIHVGIIVSATGLTFLLSAALWGRLSDRWGRKPVYIVGVCAYALGGAVFARLLGLGLEGVLTGMSAFWALLVFRAGVYATLAGGPQPAASAWVADTTSGAERTAGMALVGASFAIGSILGPAFGGLLAPFGVLTPLYCIAALGVVAALAAALVVEEPRDHAARSAARGEPLSPFDARILPLLVTSTLTFITIGATQQTAAFYIQDLSGADAAGTMRQVSVAMVAMATGILVAQVGIVQALQPAPRTLFMAGLPLAAVGFLILMTSSEVWQVVVGYALMGLGYGLSNPAVSAAVSLAVDERVQGTAAGYVSSSYAGGFIIGPLLGTGLYRIDPHITFGVCAALVATAFAIATWTTRRVGVVPDATRQDVG